MARSYIRKQSFRDKDLARALQRDPGSGFQIESLRDAHNTRAVQRVSGAEAGGRALLRRTMALRERNGDHARKEHQARARND